MPPAAARLARPDPAGDRLSPVIRGEKRDVYGLQVNTSGREGGCPEGNGGVGDTGRYEIVPYGVGGVVVGVCGRWLGEELVAFVGE